MVDNRLSIGQERRRGPRFVGEFRNDPLRGSVLGGCRKRILVWLQPGNCEICAWQQMRHKA
jgi:hypothetical protein